MRSRAGTSPGAKEAYALLARESVAVPGPDCERLGAVAREHGIWLVTGVNEVDPERPGTIYNALLYHAPDGRLALHHRKLVPTNHERLVWGQGDGQGLRAIETPLGRMGGLICWENFMPLARFALYESGVGSIASTADDDDIWRATLVHIAREARAFVIAPCHFQRAAAYPEDFPLRSRLDGSTCSGEAAARSSRPTARTSPGRCTARKESFLPISNLPACWKSGGGSTRQAITTDPTCYASTWPCPEARDRRPELVPRSLTLLAAVAVALAVGGVALADATFSDARATTTRRPTSTIDLSETPEGPADAAGDRRELHGASAGGVLQPLVRPRPRHAHGRRRRRANILYEASGSSTSTGGTAATWSVRRRPGSPRRSRTECSP